MVGEITVLKVTEAAFKKFCWEFDIEFRCIKEGITGDCWEVVFDEISDIYALGQAVGADSLIEFQNRK